MIFLRKAHLIMRQYFHTIGCNVRKKGAFSALKMITADETPSIVKKAPFSLKISYFHEKRQIFDDFFKIQRRFLFQTHVHNLFRNSRHFISCNHFQS